MSILPVANTVRNSARPISNVYYDNSNMKVASARVLNKDAYRFGFQGLALGGTATLTIPKNLMVNHVLVQLQMQVFVNAGDASMATNRYLPAGWGFNMIRRITLMYGGSEQLEIYSKANFLRAMSEAENDRKKTALLNLAGQQVYKVIGAGANNDTIVGLDAGSDRNITAVVPIYCAHSSVNALRQIGFDSGLLNQNITLRLDLEDAETMWLPGTSADNARALTALAPSQKVLTKGEWAVGQTAMIDSSASKAALVGSTGQYAIPYFWYYPQYFSAPFQLPRINAAASPLPTVSPEVNIVLNGFRSGSLQALEVAIERLDSFDIRQQPQIYGLRNPIHFLPITNVKLLFGGQVIYQADDAKVAQLLDAMVNTTDSSYTSTLAGSVADAQGPQISKIVASRSEYTRIQISQFSQVFRDYLMSGAQMGSDVMSLQFQVIDSFATVDDAAAPPINYRCNVNYIYQCALTVSRGQGSFNFVNPTPSPMPQQLNVAN